MLGTARGAAPNIVMIVSDDAGYNDFGFTAALNGLTTQADTPNIDALAAHSTVVSQAYMASSVCGPSRYGLLTGQYQNRFGAEDNLGSQPGDFTNDGTWGITPNQPTIATRLKNLGYSTGMIGKWHQGYALGVNRPTDNGFDSFYGVLGGGRTNYWYSNTAETGIWKDNQYYEGQYENEGDHSLYEPGPNRGTGRYVTDAFGEESVNYVQAHANQANPFFLYLAYTAPHDPLNDTKTSDTNHFADPNDTAHYISDPTKRSIAALSYGMDKRIGDLINTLKDPNHDGDQSDSVYDNTMIVFTNDNGAPSLQGNNAPYVGNKGTAYEGGVRTPMFIKLPGQTTQSVYTKPVTAYDLLPTAVAAAGGDVSQIATDGYNMLPQLSGQSTTNPHQTMFMRLFDNWYVRKGDWKLTIPFSGGPGFWLYNLANSTTEDNAHLVSNNAVTADLGKQFTLWEATLAKPKWGPVGAHTQNDFDHFVFRTDLANPGTPVNWSTANAWARSDTLAPATMNTGDGYANAIIEFPVRNDASYTATLNMTRVSKMMYMLNQLQLTGNFTGAASQQATLNFSVNHFATDSVLFTKSLTGQMPQLRLDATSSGTAASFSYNVGFALQMLNDLEITGDGTQNFVISGAIQDFNWSDPTFSLTDPHNVLKTGTSQVTLTGNNQFKGILTVNGGKVTLSGPSAKITSGGITVGSAGNFTLASGTVTVPTLDTSSGGTFALNGGTLKVVTVTGDLTNSGGTLSPGASPALSTISGNFAQNAGTLLMELGGTTPGTGFDRLLVNGMATVGGALAVQLISGFTPTLGQSFEILDATGGINGLFANNSFPTLPGNLSWRVLYNANSITLTIGPPGGNVLISPPGDYNQDGKVDATDYTVWQDNLGSTTKLAADGDGNGVVDAGDYTVWKNHFGISASGSGGGLGGGGSVPEPSTIVIMLVGAVLFAWRGRHSR